jgi:hypothetical protein
MKKQTLIEITQMLLIWLPFWICYKREYETYGIIIMVILSFAFYFYGTKNEKYKINESLIMFVNMFSLMLYFRIM